MASPLLSSSHMERELCFHSSTRSSVDCERHSMRLARNSGTRKKAVARNVSKNSCWSIVSPLLFSFSRLSRSAL